MPVYTAKVAITRKKKFQEEIWLEGIRAKSYADACNKAGAKARQYVDNLSNQKLAPDGYNIDLCARTKFLATKQGIQLAMGRQPVTVVDPVNTAVSTPVNVFKLDMSVFKEEVRGTFKDPFFFKKEVSVSLPAVPTYVSGYYPRGGYGYDRH